MVKQLHRVVYVENDDAAVGEPYRIWQADCIIRGSFSFESALFRIRAERRKAAASSTSAEAEAAARTHMAVMISDGHCTSSQVRLMHSAARQAWRVVPQKGIGGGASFGYGSSPRCGVHYYSTSEEAEEAARDWLAQRDYVRFGDVVDVSVRDLLALPDEMMKALSGFRAGAVFGGGDVDLPAPLTYYFLGLWLGDGAHSSTAIHGHQEETELEDYLRTYAASIGLRLVVTPDENAEDAKGVTWALNRYAGGPAGNVLRDALRELGVFGNKHLPERVFRASLSQRRELLAGLIDAAGNYKQGHGFQFGLSRDWSAAVFWGALRLGQTLGLGNSLASEYPPTPGRPRSVYMLATAFSGPGQHLIPVKLPKKRQPVYSGRRWPFPISIERVADADFYGVELDAATNQRYLLGDCTVTHNSTNYGSRAQPQPQSLIHA